MSSLTSQPSGATTPNPAGELNATLVSRRDFHRELAVFKVRPLAGNVPEFQPGQYITLGLPTDATPGSKLIKRAYSVASSPKQRDALDLYIVLVSEGQLTPRLWQLKPGDKLWMDKRCKGTFSMEGVPDGQDLVMVSTGTGLAPFLSMYHTWCGTGRWRRYVIVNGVRHAPDLGYRADLESLTRTDPTVQYIPMVTRDEDWTGVKGRVQTLLDNNLYEKLVGAPLDSKQCHVFLCGNPDMTNQMQATLEQRGFVTHSKKTPGNLHVEKYW